MRGSRRKQKAALSKEQLYLMELCKQGAGVASDDTRLLLPEECDWGHLIWWAQAHKVLPLLGSHLITKEAHRTPYSALSMLFDAVEISRVRDEQRHNAAQELQTALRSASIASIPRKGPLYQRILYGDLGVRVYGDIDFYVRREELPKAIEVAIALGYNYGYFDRFAGRAIGTERRDRLYYHLYPDHAPRLFRAENNKLAPAIHLGLALEMTWHASPYSEASRAVLDEAFMCAGTYPNTELVGPDLPFHFLDCSLHVFREAYFTRARDEGNDVTLAKFVDHAGLWEKLSSHQRVEVGRVISNSALKKPVAWAAHHTDALFGTAIVPTLGLQECASEGFVNATANAEGTVSETTEPMTVRLFAESRDRTFKRAKGGDRLVF